MKHCLEKIAYGGYTRENIASIFNRLEHKQVVFSREKTTSLVNQHILIEHLLTARQPFRCNGRNNSERQRTYPQDDHSLISEIN